MYFVAGRRDKSRKKLTEMQGNLSLAKRLYEVRISRTVLLDVPCPSAVSQLLKGKGENLIAECETETKALKVKLKRALRRLRAG